MFVKTRRLICLALILYLSIPLSPSLAQDPASDCPPNSDIIWVELESFGDGNSYPISFEEGATTYVNADGDLVTVSNYVTGLLESEIGTVTETGERWDDDLVKAMAVAIRTIAYDWCGIMVENTSDGQVHYGVLDSGQQSYRPGHAPDRADHYAKLVLQTRGQHMIYNGHTFRPQYRPYVGPQTNNSNPDGPNKGIPDPVAGRDDLFCRTGTGEEYIIPPQSGLGKHSANHWLVGAHNLDGSAPVFYSSDRNCVAIPITQSAPNVKWETYLQILVHYYTDVHIVDVDGNVLTPAYRWNPLTVAWGGGSMTPPRMAPYDPAQPLEYSVQIQLQNTGTAAWTGDTVLSYFWEREGQTVSSGPTTVLVGALTEGSHTSVNLPVRPPDTPGRYTLRLDMVTANGLYFSQREAAANRPWPTLDVEVCVGDSCASAFLPLTLKSEAAPTPPPTPSPLPQDCPTPCQEIERINLTNSDFGGGQRGWTFFTYGDDPLQALITGDFRGPGDQFPAALLGQTDPHHKTLIDAKMTQAFPVPNVDPAETVWLFVEYSYCIATAERFGPGEAPEAIDEFWVEVRNTDEQGLLEPAVHYTNLNLTDFAHNNCNPQDLRDTETGWRRVGVPADPPEDYTTKNLVGEGHLCINATDYADHPALLYFRTEVDETNPTNFYVDAIKISACMTD